MLSMSHICLALPWFASFRAFSWNCADMMKQAHLFTVPALPTEREIAGQSTEVHEAWLGALGEDDGAIRNQIGASPATPIGRSIDFAPDQSEHPLEHKVARDCTGSGS